MSKPIKWHVRLAKTQISLGIRPAERRLRSAWASAQSVQSLRCPHEESLGSLATYCAHSEDSDQTGRMPRLI